MKTLLSSALILGLLSFSTFGLVGCGEEASVKEKEVVTAPGGTTTTTNEKKVESTGSNPPTNSAGEKAEKK